MEEVDAVLFLAKLGHPFQTRRGRMNLLDSYVKTMKDQYHRKLAVKVAPGEPGVYLAHITNRAETE